MLPKKPVGIIPASVAMEGEKGEIIVFENDGYTLKNAWVVTIDAFSDKALPLGIEDGSDQERQEFFDKFAAMGGFEVVKFAELDGKTESEEQVLGCVSGFLPIVAVFKFLCMK